MSFHAPAFRRFFVICLSLLLCLSAGCGGAQARKARHLERGEAFMAEGNYEKARVEFRNALQIDPNNADIRFLSGQASEKLKNPREAAAFYQGAIDANPNHIKARASLGRMLVFAGAPDRALETIEPAMKQGEDADLLTVRGAAYMQKGNTPGAVADVQRAVQIAPSNENAVALLASLYRRAVENDKALTLLKDSVQRNPKSADLRLVLAQLYMDLQDRAGAETELKQLVVLKPEELNYRYQLALLYLGNKRVDDAEAVLRQATTVKPKDPEPKLALVEFLRAQRTRERAESELKAFIAKEPDDYALQVGLARLYESGNQPEKAEAVYRGIVKSDKLGPQGLSARNRIATLKVNASKLDEAIRLTDEVLKENPRDNDALILRGNIALAQKRPAAAIADLRAVLRDQPNTPAILRALARAHLQNNEPALAEENLRAAVQANPGDPDTRLDLAQFLVRRQRADEAIDVLESLVHDAPANVIARNLLGEVELLQKKAPQAVKTFADASLVSPEWWLPYRNKALAQLMQQDRKGAEETYKQGIGTSDNPAVLIADLAALYEHDGKIDAAIGEYERWIEREPGSEAAANNLAMLLVTYRKDSASLDRAHELVAKFSRSDNAAYLDTHGWVQYKRGEIAAALPAFEQAVNRSPDSPVMRYHLGMAQYRSGQFAEARTNLSKALDAGVKFAGVDEARTTLGEIDRKKSGAKSG